LTNGTLLLSVLLPLEGLDAETLAARLLAFSDVAIAVCDALAASGISDVTPADLLPDNGLRC
jgi:hypothetical protein